MHMPFGRALRPAADHRRAGQIALTDIEARSDAHSAKIGKTPGLHGDVRQAGRLPEAHGNADARSAEHTSELQSLMRISYAFFCLKKKKITRTNNNEQKQQRLLLRAH